MRPSAVLLARIGRARVLGHLGGVKAHRNTYHLAPELSSRSSCPIIDAQALEDHSSRTLSDFSSGDKDACRSAVLCDHERVNHPRVFVAGEQVVLASEV